MNKTTTALVIKFVLTFGAAWMAFALIDNNHFGWVLILAVIGTIVNYLIGDLIILAPFRAVVAAVGDGLMAILLAFILDILTPNSETSFSGLLAFGALIIFAEYYFHIYILETGNMENKKR